MQPIHIRSREYCVCNVNAYSYSSPVARRIFPLIIITSPTELHSQPIEISIFPVPASAFLTQRSKIWGEVNGEHEQPKWKKNIGTEWRMAEKKKIHPHADTHSSHLSNAKCTQFINERRSRQCGPVLHIHSTRERKHNAQRWRQVPEKLREIEGERERAWTKKKMFETIFQPLYFDKLKNESKRCERVPFVCWILISLTHSLSVIYRFSNMYFFIFYLRAVAAIAATDAITFVVFALKWRKKKKSKRKSALESLQRAQRSTRNAHS